MAQTHGRNKAIKLWDGSSEHALSPQPTEIADFAMTRVSEDNTPFGATVMSSYKSLQETPVFEFTGNYDSTDTNGWAKLRAAVENKQELSGAAVFNSASARIRFYEDTSLYHEMDASIDVTIVNSKTLPNRWIVRAECSDPATFADWVVGS